MNKAETRAEHIDPAPPAAGWGVVDGSRIRREYGISPGRLEGHGRRSKPLPADYILEYRDPKLAIVEASIRPTSSTSSSSTTTRPTPARCCWDFVEGLPLHVIVAREDETADCYLVTVYRPDPALRDRDFRTRR